MQINVLPLSEIESLHVNLLFKYTVDTFYHLSGTDQVVWDTSVRHKHTLLLSCTDIQLGNFTHPHDIISVSGRIYKCFLNE